MGDIHPCRGRWVVSWNELYQEMIKWGQSQNTARIMAAIASAESGNDLAVINDTPATGDYSVGAWQINYYGSLRAGRTRLFGTPCHLINSGASGQAAAAIVIANSQGFIAWSTYNSGEYRKYLHGFAITPTGGGPGGVQPFTVGPAPGPGADDHSGTVRRTAGLFSDLARNAYPAWKRIERARQERIL